jgi:tRNA1(Val) A37 N6-methylase TrmN6
MNDRLEARRAALEAELGEPITLDGLTASLFIFQRKRGHRHSTDDLLTGWYALEHVARAGGASAASGRARRWARAGGASAASGRALDLGAGIGGVGLLVLSGLGPGAHLTCVEAQDISFRFLRENVAANGLDARVTAIHGDLRDLALSERFPLVTGSPPYFDPKGGVVPSDSQKAHARFELRGDVSDYARAAKRHLDHDGLFVFCFPWQQRARAIAAVRAEGFSIASRRDVIPREGASPLFSLFACRLGTHEEKSEPPLVVRDREGAHTEALRAVRARFGWP